eukprot:COSAG05_NODE_60_length_23142_cov_25.372130_15_plen_426_part_00
MLHVRSHTQHAPWRHAAAPSALLPKVSIDSSHYTQMHAGPVWLSRREPESWRIFYTERWASIKDRRLAYPSAIGWWVTLLYGLWSLIIEGGYLELDTQLRGVLRPRLNNRPAATYHENKGEFSIDRKFSPALDTDGPVPAYCTGRHLGRFPGVRTGGIRCEYWDPISASRALGPGGIFVATRVQERQEISVCQPRTSEYAIGSAIGEDMSDWGRLPGPTRPLCRDGFKQEWVRQTFLEGVDDFVLKVNGNIEAHTFAASSTVCRERLIWKHDNRELNGTLVGPAGEDICTSPPGEPDAFPLRDWLRAAGIDSLEDQTDSFETKPGLSTLRHEGMVLEVSYEYSNTQAISFSGALAARLNCEEPAPFQYKIKVKRVAGSEFKIEEVVSSEQGCDLSCPPGHTKADRSPNGALPLPLVRARVAALNS